MLRDDFVWSEIYRPKTIGECILSTDIKKTLEAFLKKGDIPNLLFTGKSGVGKTTAARALLDELDRDYMMINGSLEGRNIDTLRTTIKDYASSVSFKKGRKYVILDEADYLNPQTVQPALRNFMEEYSTNCGFILTCNYKSKIIEPLLSRMSQIVFSVPASEKVEISKQIFERVEDILKKQKVKYDKISVMKLIAQHFPDIRKCLNELQRYSATGQIDSGIVDLQFDQAMQTLTQLLKKKDFTGMRKWVALNNEGDNIFRALYDAASTICAKESVPALVLLIAKYQYQHAFVADPEINIVACLTEIMVECEFK